MGLRSRRRAMNWNDRLKKIFGDVRKNHRYGKPILMDKMDIILRTEIFNHKLTEKMERFLRRGGLQQPLGELNILVHGPHQMTCLNIPDAHDVKRVVVQFVFDQFEEFSIVLKSSLHALKALRLDWVR